MVIDQGLKSRSVFTRLLCLFAVAAVAVVVQPTVSPAATGDCGQPVTNGTAPGASDCLGILQHAVGVEICSHNCLCDVDGSGAVVATDADICLQRVVRLDVELVCQAC